MDPADRPAEGRRGQLHHCAADPLQGVGGRAGHLLLPRPVVQCARVQGLRRRQPVVSEMNVPLADVLPTFADVEDAAKRLAGKAIETPLIESQALNEQVGGRVLLKPEMLQVSGSFKFRGAYNRISRFSEDEKQKGVVAYSSGNHAQGVAAAAQLVGTRALIVMPHDAPQVKVDGVKAFGGDLRADGLAAFLPAVVEANLAAERGSVLVPPFDENHNIAGQG